MNSDIITHVDARIAIALLNLVRVCFSAVLWRQPKKLVWEYQKKAVKTRVGGLPAKAAMNPVTEKNSFKAGQFSNLCCDPGGLALKKGTKLAEQTATLFSQYFFFFSFLISCSLVRPEERTVFRKTSELVWSKVLGLSPSKSCLYVFTELSSILHAH